MRETELQKRAVLDRIQHNRLELARECRELKETFDWTRTLTGSVLALVSRRPLAWKRWMRVLPLLPFASTLLGFVLSRGKKRKGKKRRRD